LIKVLSWVGGQGFDLYGCIQSMFMGDLLMELLARIRKGGHESQ